MTKEEIKQLFEKLIPIFEKGLHHGTICLTASKMLGNDKLYSEFRHDGIFANFITKEGTLDIPKGADRTQYRIQFMKDFIKAQ